ncbi:hypothetical protein ABZR86_03565 [Dyella marensis]|jgi:hypothetical protein|uniref:Uncharacterized protein n=1 Tax=Dyella marensis TaxID=500610 RepID=A0A1I1ZAG5_9GAMM|nr:MULTISPECIES: hypothetical protein [Dyella]SFE28685.1 hypothetical protein SAMN02799615_00662 [Dyella marensis]
MKVQLQDQTLRLRIDEAELAQLLDGASVGNRTQWPDGRVEEHRLVLGQAHGWQRDADGWQVMLGDAEVRAFVARLPSRDGLEIALPVPGGAPLQLLFDVDVRDSVRHRRQPKAS